MASALTKPGELYVYFDNGAMKTPRSFAIIISPVTDLIMLLYHPVVSSQKLSESWQLALVRGTVLHSLRLAATDV
jgi:hypothetical protein